MWELGAVVYIALQEAPLLFGSGVSMGMAEVRSGVMVVVCPLNELIGEVVSWEVGPSVLEVDDNQLLVFVRRLQQRRFCIVGLEAKNVSVLGLEVKTEQLVSPNSFLSWYRSVQ